MKTPISTTAAPGAIGPYSQAIDTGSFVFASGQIPIDPATGNIAEGIKAQTRQSLANVKAILNEAGLTLDNVVKTTVFLADMNDFAAMNEVYDASSIAAANAPSTLSKASPWRPFSFALAASSALGNARCTEACVK